MQVDEAGHGGSRERWVGYVDWRNKPALKDKHGGMLAATFVLVVEVLENLAFLANASNLVLYLTRFMHLTPSRASNGVTNFMGTAFLLALLGGFLSDAFLTTYAVYLISAAVELAGLVILTIQARTPSLKPPETCTASPCPQVSGTKAAVLYAGLYLVALGVGGIKGSLPSHGAEQFDESTQQGRKGRSTFFNYFVFCLSAGGLVAVTLVVWVEDNKGWQWGFGVSTLAVLLSVPVFLAGSKMYRNKIPTGSPLTTIAKVIIAAFLNYNNNSSNGVHHRQKNHHLPLNAVIDVVAKNNHAQVDGTHTPAKHMPIMNANTTVGDVQLTSSLRFLNRAAAPKPAVDSAPAVVIQNNGFEQRSLRCGFTCTAGEVEDVKSVLRMLPIFLSTVMLSCCLAQLSTFSVQQAATMNTTIGSLTVPPASLPFFPIVSTMILAPLYDHVLAPLLSRVTGAETGLTHLQRVGTGLLLSVAAMASAALVEGRRERVLAEHAGQGHPLPMTFLWVAVQYLLLGSADLFTLAGLLEFFFTEAPQTMRSLATSMSWASLALGYYLSSVIVDVVNRVTSPTSWLAGEDLDAYRLNKFYWLMCALSAVNYVIFVILAVRYRYNSGHQRKQQWQGGKKGAAIPGALVEEDQRGNGHVQAIPPQQR